MTAQYFNKWLQQRRTVPHPLRKQRAIELDAFYDVVLIARTPALELPMSELEAEARSLLDRLSSNR